MWIGRSSEWRYVFPLLECSISERPEAHRTWRVRLSSIFSRVDARLKHRGTVVIYFDHAPNGQMPDQKAAAGKDK